MLPLYIYKLNTEDYRITKQIFEWTTKRIDYMISTHAQPDILCSESWILQYHYPYTIKVEYPSSICLILVNISQYKVRIRFGYEPDPVFQNAYKRFFKIHIKRFFHPKLLFIKNTKAQQFFFSFSWSSNEFGKTYARSI